MRIFIRLLSSAGLLFTAGCSTSEKNQPGDLPATPTLTDPVQQPAVKGEPERFIIRDKQQRIRVDGHARSGRMDGMWIYYDSKGEKLAIVNYRLDHRHGPVQLFFVTADGPAVGRSRMTGNYADGSLNGMIESRWASSGKKLERDFDRGILQGARGWSEKGARMSDGDAMRAAIEESRAEDALLTELENFAMLQVRTKAAASGNPAPELAPEPPAITAPMPSPYAGGTAPLSNP